MGGGKQKKEDKRRKKPITTAGKAIKRMGGSIGFARDKRAADADRAMEPENPQEYGERP